MKTLSERLRGPIKHPQQLMTQRIEAADSIDELVKSLRLAILWTDEEHDVGDWRSEAQTILAKHKENS